MINQTQLDQTDPERYRRFAEICRQAAYQRVRPDDRAIMLVSAAEFDERAAEAEALGRTPYSEG